MSRNIKLRNHTNASSSSIFHDALHLRPSVALRWTVSTLLCQFWMHSGSCREGLDIDDVPMQHIEFRHRHTIDDVLNCRNWFKVAARIDKEFPVRVPWGVLYEPWRMCNVEVQGVVVELDELRKTCKAMVCTINSCGDQLDVTRYWNLQIVALVHAQLQILVGLYSDHQFCQASVGGPFFIGEGTALEPLKRSQELWLYCRARIHKLNSNSGGHRDGSSPALKLHRVGP
mmetsp:Transcript_41271/g.94983  ORF Transcript_41271/g.94983 Transcript_41271/m.94983 type:complete len:229 (+) Transcript_41271:1076-1762(+)